jgi:hypothetical protein
VYKSALFVQDSSFSTISRYCQCSKWELVRFFVPPSLAPYGGGQSPGLPENESQGSADDMIERTAHQVQRPLEHFRLFCIGHVILPLHIPKEATISPLQCP